MLSPSYLTGNGAVTARTFDIPRILADARAGTLSAGDMRRAIEKAEDWGLSDAALQLRQLLPSKAAAGRSRVPKPAAGTVEEPGKSG
jgi:hypothetical protein